MATTTSAALTKDDLQDCIDQATQIAFYVFGLQQVAGCVSA
jgi:hypothetical protein